MVGVANWMRNGPGCCCHAIGLNTMQSMRAACACYRFDEKRTVAGSTTARNQAFDALHLTSFYPEYVTGKIIYASKHTGEEHHEHVHNNCYVPTSTDAPLYGSTGSRFGINVWFWIKRVKPTASTVGKDIEYVATKGLFPDTAEPWSTAPNDCDFPGTWSIFIDPTTSATGLHADLHFAVAYENSCVDVTLQQSWEDPTDWVHFFWWYEPTAGTAGAHTGRYSIIRNGVTTVDEQTVAVGVEGNPMRQTDNEKFYVGKFLGADQDETILIDNLGVSRRIGTKAQMTARAADAYNAGVGKACP